MENTNAQLAIASVLSILGDSFPLEKVRSALEEAKGSVEGAIDVLLNEGLAGSSENEQKRAKQDVDIDLVETEVLVLSLSQSELHSSVDNLKDSQKSLLASSVEMSGSQEGFEEDSFEGGFSENSMELEDSDMAMFEEVEICDDLRRDMDAVERMFGEETILVEDKAFGETKLRLSVSAASLTHTTASAWKVDANAPIELIFKKGLSNSLYMNGEKPVIAVVQKRENGDMFGIGKQLEFLVEAFVTKEWDAFQRRGRRYYQDLTTKERRTMSGPPKTFRGKIVIPQEYYLLMEMGYKEEAILCALYRTSTIEEAGSFIAEQPRKCTYKHLKRFERKMNKFKQETSHSAVKKEEELREMQTWRVKPENGFLVGLMQFVLHRIPTLNLFCTICDGPHLFGALLPSVCNKPICSFSFQSLGLMSDCVDGLATQEHVVDLLVSMARAAVSSPRKAILFDPFPSVFDKDKVILSPKKKDFALCKEILDALHVKEIIAGNIDTSRPINNHAVSLMHWIVSSNRCHLVKLPEKNMFQSFKTSHQYLLLSTTPEKEEAFQRKKAKKGSVWAWHGSGACNWWAILRKGLKNCSGTKLQVNGAAHGSGIYLSPSSVMSIGYSKKGTLGHKNNNNNNNNKNAFLDDSNFLCLALCEIIQGAIGKKFSFFFSFFFFFFFPDLETSGWSLTRTNVSPASSS